jgi:biotin synthase-related radical SAM superfamily protein
LSEQTLVIERDALKKTLLEDIKKKDSVEHKITAEFQELKKVEVSLEKLRLSGKPRV